MKKPEWRPGAKILKTLQDAEVELDQRMLDALRLLGGPAIDSTYLVAALQVLNTHGFAVFPDLTESIKYQAREPRSLTGVEGLTLDSSPILANVLAHADTSRGTLGASEYLRALVEHGIDNPQYESRSIVLDQLAYSVAGTFTVDLRDVPRIQALLASLRASPDGASDYQYILAFDENRMRFRVVSNVGDFVQAGDSGLLVPHRALLTHIDDLGFFTLDSIEELEELINNPRTLELEFQRFFERYPTFFRIWDYRKVYPHVYLAREGDGDLIPDFILTNAAGQKAAVVELKRASAMKGRLVRHQDNRVRFADAVMEARAQLMEYRDWFDNPHNREMVRSTVGMEIYRPRMMVIIGRASEFKDGIQRAKLADRHPDIEIVTYDDILRQAKERRSVVELPWHMSRRKGG